MFKHASAVDVICQYHQLWEIENRSVVIAECSEFDE